MRSISYTVRLAAVLCLAAGLSTASAAWAHHGWGWAEGEEFEITGTIERVDLGYPHGEVVIRSGGALWVVEVGQPYRNRDAGLADGFLRPGVTITAHGHRSADPDELLVKAERVIIDGKSYNLYPDRDSD